MLKNAVEAPFSVSENLALPRKAGSEIRVLAKSDGKEEGEVLKIGKRLTKKVTVIVRQFF